VNNSQIETPQTIPSLKSAFDGRLLPKVGVVIPTYERPSMLRRLLNSLARQTYPSDRFDVVVVGGDGDPARDVVRDFASSVGFPVAYHIVDNEQQRSVSLKRNTGARIVSGDILAFVDDDCEADPYWMSAAIPAFEDPRVGGVEGRIHIPVPDRPTPTYRASLRLSVQQGYRTGNIFYRRTTFNECGGFDESLPYFEDTDLGCTVIGRGYSIPFVREAVVSHAVHSGRPSWHLNMARAADQLPYLFAKHSDVKPLLRRSIHLFNRSHYLYLSVYVLALLFALRGPVAGIVVLGTMLPLLVGIQLTRQWWGLHFTLRELFATALVLPLVPLVRLAYWAKGSVEMRLGMRDRSHPAKR
jgi:cellulose synthase/poly-beta-1,6-N-acetylglucosamine synthase-like glycosyltransferase